MNTTKETIKFFWQHAWQYKQYVIAILVASPLAILFHTFLSSLIIANILDRLAKGDFIHHDFFGSFGGTILLFIGVYAVGNIVLYRILTFLMWKLEMMITRDIAEQTFNHLMKLDMNFHANHFAGSLVSQATKLQSAYQRLADTTIYSVAPLLLTFVFASIVLLPRAPFFVPILLLLASLYITVAILTAKKIRHLNTQEAQANSQQTGLLADSITNIIAVKSFAGDEFESRRFASATKKTFRANARLLRATLGRDTYFSIIGSGFSIAALIMAIISVMYFQADIATAFLVLTYSLAIATRLWDFSANALKNYNKSFGDAYDMIKIIHQASAVKYKAKPIKLAAGNGSVKFNHISFAHPERKDTLFTNLTLTIKPGEKIGLIGHSGSGKTTLSKLLLRFSNLNGGEILINDQDITRLTQEDLHRQIAYVPQEPILFHRSIKENIAYGKPDATDNDIHGVAKKAYIAEFIKTLPRGYDTLVGEHGVKLSGGQRQRIAIARAILKDAPILVLDEATSALDSESEKFIQSALLELMQDRTAIVIAHRLSTIQKMDRIIVLDEGKIIEDGPHTKLLEKNGMYAKLWSHQSGGFIE